MRNNKKLVLDQLNRKFESLKPLESVEIPRKGWIYTIRKSLNMTQEQLGRMLGMTRQGVHKLEEREVKGTITLKSLKEVSEVLNLNLIYGFTSKFGSIEKMVEKRARALATKIVSRTSHNMKLENQALGDSQIQKAIDELTQELKNEMRKSLWD